MYKNKWIKEIISVMRLGMGTAGVGTRASGQARGREILACHSLKQREADANGLVGLAVL